MKQLITPAILIVLYFGIHVFGTSFPFTLDTDTPAGSDLPSVLDDRIREVKDAFIERLNVDHFFIEDTTDGQVQASDTGGHRKLTMGTLTATPTITDSQGKFAIIWVDNSDSRDLYYTTATHTVRIVASGTLSIDEARLSNNIYLTAYKETPTSTVDLIRANVDDKSALPSGAVVTATPTTDFGIANKRYVDELYWPVARISLSADQTANSASFIKATLNTADSDFDTGVVDTGNNRITPAVIGNYVIYAQAVIENVAGGQQRGIAIFVNGAEIARQLATAAPAAANEGFSITILAKLDGDDFIEMYWIPGTSGTTRLSGGSRETYLHIYRLGIIYP